MSRSPENPLATPFVAALVIATDRDKPQLGPVAVFLAEKADFGTESYRQFSRDRFLSASLMKWMYDMYIADPAKRTDVHAAPLRASAEQLKGLPPALIQVAENDILRDEGEAYGRKLDEAGVESPPIVMTA